MKQSRFIDEDPIYHELYEAFTFYASRHPLVIHAILDQGVSPSELGDRGVRAWFDRTPQKGGWGSDWQFFFHGGGCRIIHQRTGETIDWSGSDPESIDPGGFVTHLRWRLKQGHVLPLLEQYVQQHGSARILDLLYHLIDENLISSDFKVVLAANSTRANAA